MPGLQEILEFIDFLFDFYDSAFLKANIELIPLHSSLSEEEQDRAFRVQREGRRKVIVATNIAESSITIPDVKYVVDFLLTKELHYDPQTQSEALMLNFVSKASAKQRMGRAGRVADGFAFRLCKERFFHTRIPEYPKPEMQRCPLERLILKIKLWNKYHPEQVLGRAIQPPELRDIHLAIKTLQQTGALTIPPDEEGVPQITGLGKIFVNLPVDIKITRIFLFGMALKCMGQAIMIGCIHS